MAAVRVRRRLALFLLVLALSFLLIGVAVYALFLADLPPVSAVEQRLVRPTTRILDRSGRLLYEVIDPNAGKQIDLSLADVPVACVQATLATEDSRFYAHPGIDPIAIARAAWQNFRAESAIVSGGSTLTQQVARNLLLDASERYSQTYQRKLREAWLALLLEARYSKDEILSLYLNQTYYGNFAFGLEAAAQVFFAKPARQLSRGECSLLAGLVQFPTGYNPLVDAEAAKARQLTVLRLMHEAGFISAEERQAIAAEPLRYKSRLFDITAPHFVMFVQDLLVQRLGPDRLRDGGLTVTTTLDADLQSAAQTAVRHRLELLNCRRPGLCDAMTNPNRRVENAAIVVLDSQNGDILAMVGSPDYFDARIQGNVNAALSLRQPGSAIKPLTYAVALDPEWSTRLGLAPLTPASIIADLPVTFHVKDANGGNVPYTPINYDRQSHGPVSVREALANSYNIPAVKVLDRVGVASLKEIAAQSGISTFTRDFGLALTLGGGEVRLLELTAAYGILDDGIRLDPQAILRVSAGGTTILDARLLPVQPSASRLQVISPQTAYLLTDILADRTARLPAFGGDSPLDLPFPAAVKTGTTTDWRDNWTIGYTTKRIVGVWVGNADNTPMLDVSGVDGAGPIWRDVMLAAHPTPPTAFQRPDGITEVLICAPSGLLPTPHCPRTRLERFIAGTEPTQNDDQFQAIVIDRATGLRADDSTPPERRLQRVYWMLPPEYHAWMLSNGVALAPPARQVNHPVAAQVARTNGELYANNERAPLVLTSPVAHTAYQLHPSLPAENQRIEIAGYAAEGGAWAELRLVKDGEVLASGQGIGRLSQWWILEPGQHRFWLEGIRTSTSEPERSSQSLVVVGNYQRPGD